MQWLNTIGEVLVRAAYLLALAIAPPFLSPEPAPPANALVGAVIAAALLAAVVVGAARLRTRAPGRDTLAAAALLWIAVAASIAAAAVFRGDRAPLGRGVLYVAVPAWAGLVVAAGAVAERRLGSFRWGRLVAGVIVVGAAAAMFAVSARWLLNPPLMWSQAVRRDGNNVRALDEITRPKMAAHDYAAVRRITDACLAIHPSGCACLAMRADVGLHLHDAEQALADARATSAACPATAATRAALAEALAGHGEAELAEAEARKGIAQGDDARLHYALALALEREGKRPEAIAEAKRAVDMGGGRDARVLQGALAITSNDLDQAASALGPVVKTDPNDADAQYDLALIADKKNDYNHARQGYLAALRADPKLANARYNLALLTLRQGVIDEARHHAQKFAETFPDDPRNASLAKLMPAATKQ